MTDLIYRQKAINAAISADMENHNRVLSEKRARVIESHLRVIAAVDAEPVRHGKNIGTDYDETDQFVCSECGIEIQGWYRVEHDEDDDDETIHEYRFRYCPHCGARISE
jgi:DNA-directed RNA polymerase subunit RPC12/RpoP